MTSAPTSSKAILLSSTEQRAFAWRLSLALTAAAALALSLILKVLEPDQKAAAQLLAASAALLAGIPALIAAWKSLRFPDLHGITDQLIALAFIAAWASGDLITAALLPLIMMIGHILEERSLLGSQEAIRALTNLTEKTARRIDQNGDVSEVNVDDLSTGDVIEVRAGDRIPADGDVLVGTSSVDTASITGESVPLDVTVGSKVFGGSINLEGVLSIKISQVGKATTLGRVIALMQQAERIKPAITKLLERYANGYLALVLIISSSVWFLTGSASSMLAILVASCPVALVLAAPATSIAAISVAGRHGILVKGAAFLEQLASVDAAVFDKTGTITTGELKLVGVHAEQGVSSSDLLRIAGSLGAVSSHPVSRAVGMAIAEDERLELSDAKETRGLGIVALLDGDTVGLGRAALFEKLGISPSSPPLTHDGPLAGVSKGNQFLGWVLLADQIRPEASRALQDLRELGLERQIMITGDRRREADRIAGLVNIMEVHAETLPHDKMQFVQSETAKGFRTLVVGDGINDALALKAGAVGIAMGAHGTDVALASADLVLMTNDLRRLGTCIRLSRLSRRTIMVNIGIGLGWTVVVVSIAALGVFGTGSALVAALMQNFGTIAVMANAGRLLRFQDHTSTADFGGALTHMWTASDLQGI